MGELGGDPKQPIWSDEQKENQRKQKVRCQRDSSIIYTTTLQEARAVVRVVPT